MKKLIKSSIFFTLFLSSFALITQAEVTNSEGDTEDDGTPVAVATGGACSLRVTGNYNIRIGPEKSEQRCNTFLPPFNYEVAPVSIIGDWVQFSSAQTVGCMAGQGWTHKNAFNDEDLANYKAGKCDGTRVLDNGAAADDNVNGGQTSVASTNNRGHIFPLPQCLGLKNGGGLGYYHAPRKGHRHGGTDYYSPRGTQVQSPCDGKVIGRSVRYKGSDVGNALTIKCDNGDQFKMFHLNDTPKHASQGQRLSKGELVGGVGNTGNANGQAPHLHLEATIGGSRVDPQSLWKCGGNSGK